MPDTRLDERSDRTPEEEAALILARKTAEAEAELIDEKVKLAVIGGAAMGIVGLLVVLLAAWRENVPLTITGATIGLVSFGVVTAAQAGKLFGRDG